MQPEDRRAKILSDLSFQRGCAPSNPLGGGAGRSSFAPIDDGSDTPDLANQRGCATPPWPISPAPEPRSSVSVIFDTELSSLTDRADSKAKNVAAPSLKRRCRIVSRLNQPPAKRQYRRWAARSHPERRATIRADQLGANSRVARFSLLVAEMALRM